LGSNAGATSAYLCRGWENTLRILVVEDEKKLASLVQRALREDGHAVDLAETGQDGAHLATTENYDLIVLDLLLPDRDGITVLQELRRARKSAPVIILTAKDTVKDRVTGLDAGADDYLTKPFAMEELRARVRALLRRGQGSTSTVLKYADLTMNLLERRVFRGKRELELTGKEFALLELLLRNPKRVLTRTSISEHLWDYTFERESNVIDAFVKLLRKKLEAHGEARLIQTVRGVGYVLKEETDGG